MSYLIVLRNHAPRGQRQIEPVLVRVESEGVALPNPLQAVTFAPRRFEAVSCTRPMVYGVNNSPRVRMRRDDQLGVRVMRTDRYEVIGRRQVSAVGRGTEPLADTHHALPG